jgi:hypothetical protein
MHDQRNALNLTTQDLLGLCRRYARLSAEARRAVDAALRGREVGRNAPAAAWLEEAAAYTADDDAAHLAAQLREVV